MFKKNVGSVERALRIIVGLALIVVAVLNQKGIWNGINIGYWGYIGIIPLLTGLISSCPLYTLFGINTCSTKK